MDEEEEGPSLFDVEINYDFLGFNQIFFAFQSFVQSMVDLYYDTWKDIYVLTCIALGVFLLLLLFYLYNKQLARLNHINSLIRFTDVKIWWLLGAEQQIRETPLYEIVRTQYRLTHFDTRGRAEVCRMMFHLFGVPFEDVRMQEKQWNRLGSVQQFYHLPTLRVGKVLIMQAIPISRFLAKEFGISGRNNWEAGLCDMMINFVSDNLLRIFQYRSKMAEEEKVLLYAKSTIIPRFLYAIESQLQTQKSKKCPYPYWIIGDEMTWADVYIVDALLEIEELTEGENILGRYSNLKELYERFLAIPSISNYLQTRSKLP